MHNKTRLECYGRITELVRQRATAYFEQHPEELDERGEKSIVELSHLIADIFNVLDLYTIEPGKAETN